MRYEVIEQPLRPVSHPGLSSLLECSISPMKYDPHQGKYVPITLPKATLPITTVPLVKIYPEQTNVQQLCIAMVQSAYEMAAFIDNLPSLSEKEAAKYLRYDTEKSLVKTIVDRILRRPDTRIPTGITADYVKGRRVKLHTSLSIDSPVTYEMNPRVFTRDVGSIDELFRLTQQRLEK